MARGRRYRRWDVIAIAILFGVPGTAATASTWSTEVRALGSPESLPLALAVSTAGLLLLGTVLVLAVLSVVEVRGDLLRIRNGLVVHEVAARDVADVSTGAWGPIPGVGVVALRDGRRVAMLAIGTGPAPTPHNREVDRWLDELRAWAAAHR